LLEITLGFHFYMIATNLPPPYTQEFNPSRDSVEVHDLLVRLVGESNRIELLHSSI
jgi:hypothetical protein